MPFRIELTQSALDDLDRFKKRERNIILDGIEEQLTREPLRETRNRKQPRENPLSHWELRVGHKVHNKLFIGGEEFEL